MKKELSLLISSLTLIMLITTCQVSYGQMKTEEFSFEYDGKKYSGLLDLPRDEKPTAIVVMIHGHGKTNVVEKNWYAKTRSKFVSTGIAVCIWDKAGCGKSEGEYKHNQTVQSSANEALVAIEKLKQLNIVNPDKIGLWGISRAGWICPLIIEEDKSIAFWISASGTDDLDNYRYLLENNLRIEGRTESEIEVLISEFDYCYKYQRGGKTYDEFIGETKNLFNDPFCKKLGMGLDSEDDFINIIKYYQNSGFVYDEKTGLQILVPDFQKTLNNVNCPVLSISGEKDSQVDWKKTIKLYKETIGKNENATLTIKTLPNCNHNIQKCVTGGLFEDL
ncbi:MAG: alpha/beta hydrolase, partial [Melioribacteraceae bacterium]|nr:alpha/beta hydrolase [Melioribacteraceae bacterium]